MDFGVEIMEVEIVEVLLYMGFEPWCFNLS
jgi:hypothetical protein